MLQETAWGSGKPLALLWEPIMEDFVLTRKERMVLRAFERGLKAGIPVEQLVDRLKLNREPMASLYFGARKKRAAQGRVAERFDVHKRSEPSEPPVGFM